MSYLSKPFLIFLPVLSYTAAVLILTPHITRAAGNTYHVRQDGGGDCTTIQECVNKVQGPGDTIIVHGGTYASFNTFTELPSTSGSDLGGGAITLRAAGDGPVWLRGQLDMWNNGPQWWIIDGINVDSGDIGRNSILVSENVRIQNLEATRALYYGIGFGSNNQVVNVRSYNHGQGPTQCGGVNGEANGQCHGFYLHGDNNLLDGVEVYNTDGQGVMIGAGGGNHNTVRNSKFHDIPKGSAIGIAYAGSNLIYNNVMYSNNKEGIYIFASNNQQVYNNTIYGNELGIGLVNGTSNSTLRNNIVFNNGTNIADEGSNTQSNTLTTDPNFVNAGSGDFHLTSGSPARDAGVSLPEVPCDADGNARPAGSAYDIGAYEYGSSPGGGCSGGGTNPTPTPVPSSSPCTQYTNQSQIPTGFGVPWDVTNPNVMLVSAQCTPPTILLKAGDPNTTRTIYVYKDGYVAPSGGSSWSPVQLFGSSLISGAWYKSSAQGVTNIPDQTKATYYVAYTCIWTGSAWKCGCRDAQCMQSYWQLQRIQ